MEIKSDEKFLREVQEKVEKWARNKVTAYTSFAPVMVPTVIISSHCSESLLMYERDKCLLEEKARKWYRAYVGEENEYSERAKENREKYFCGEGTEDFQVFLNRLYQYAHGESEGGSGYAVKEEWAIAGKYVARYIRSDTLSAAYSFAMVLKDEESLEMRRKIIKSYDVEHASWSHSVYCLESYIAMGITYGYSAYSLFSEFRPIYHELLDKINDAQSFPWQCHNIPTSKAEIPCIPYSHYTFNPTVGLFADMECYIPACKKYLTSAEKRE